MDCNICYIFDFFILGVPFAVFCGCVYDIYTHIKSKTRFLLSGVMLPVIAAVIGIISWSLYRNEPKWELIAISVSSVLGSILTVVCLLGLWHRNKKPS